MTPRQLIGIGLASLLLAACGSSDDDDGLTEADARAPAKLETADDALSAVAYLELAVGLNEPIEGFGQLAPQIARKAIQGKLSFNAQCENGGQITFNDNNRDDYRLFQFSSCTGEDGRRLDGRLEIECRNGDFSSQNSCSNTRVQFGLPGGASLVAIEPSGDRIALRGDWQLQEDESSEQVDQNLRVELSAPADNRSLLGITEGFRLFTQSDGGSGTLNSVNGRVGLDFAGPNVSCTTGQIDVLTLEQIRVDSNDEVRGGQVRISNESGQAATVSFSDDGGVTISIDGSTQSFSRSQRLSRCAFTDS